MLKKHVAAPASDSAGTIPQSVELAAAAAFNVGMALLVVAMSLEIAVGQIAPPAIRRETTLAFLIGLAIAAPSWLIGAKLSQFWKGLVSVLCVALAVAGCWLTLHA